MARRLSKLHVFALAVAGMALFGMSVSALRDHRVAFNFFALFAVVGVFAPGALHIAHVWLRALLLALYLSSMVLLALAEFGLLHGTFVAVGRWALIVSLAALLVGRAPWAQQHASSMRHGT